MSQSLTIERRTAHSSARHAERPRHLLRRVFKAAEAVFAVLGVLFLTYHLFFNLSVITSDSMSPTLQGTSPENGDWVLSESCPCTSGIRAAGKSWPCGTTRTFR